MASTLGATDVALITTTTNPVLAPADQVMLTKVTVCNTDVGAPHGVFVYRVPPGGNVSASAVEMIGNLSIAAGATVVLPLAGQPLPTGYALYAKQDSGSGMNLNIGWLVL